MVKLITQSSELDECYNYLKHKKVISLDIETTRKYGGKYGQAEGLDPYLSEIVMIQIGDEHTQYVIDHRKVRVDKLLPILSDASIQKVGHNLKFEYVHFLHNYGVRLDNIYDTQIAEELIYRGYNFRVGLKDLIERYLNKEVDKSTRLEFLNIRDRDFSDRQIKYGAEDIELPMLIREKQLLSLKHKDLENCFNLEMLFLRVLGDIEYKGMHFNKDKWLDTYHKNLQAFKDTKVVLNNYVLENYGNSKFVNRQLDLFSTGIHCNIKWTSSKQVVSFFKFLKICPQEISASTGKLSFTVNAKVLRASLETTNKDIKPEFKDLINIYLQFKELEQACTTFGKDFLKHIHPITGRIHSNYKQILNTGRISSRNPNLQNIPSGEDFRSCFTAPKGCKIVNADYSGQETVILANKSKEPNIIRLITEGGDMHCFVTRAINPEIKDLSDDEIKKLHKDKRQVAKSAGFAIQYGGNGHTIAKNLGISEQEGDFVYDSYFKAFPELKKYFDRVINKSLNQGYIEIDEVTKRKFFFAQMNELNEYRENKLWKQFFKLKSKYAKAALNYPVQGTAGSITKLAAVLIHKFLIDNNLSAAITNLVHDEINVETEDSIATIVAENLEKSMEKAGDKWCKIVPLKADAQIVEYWKH